MWFLFVSYYGCNVSCVIQFKFIISSHFAVGIEIAKTEQMFHFTSSFLSLNTGMIISSNPNRVSYQTIFSFSSSRSHPFSTLDAKKNDPFLWRASNASYLQSYRCAADILDFAFRAPFMPAHESIAISIALVVNAQLFHWTRCVARSVLRTSLTECIAPVMLKTHVWCQQQWSK